MTWGLIVLGGVDAALLVTAVVIARHAEDFRVWEVLAVCVVAVLIHLVGLYVYKESLIRAGNADAVGRLSVLVTSLATGAPAAVVFAHIFISVVSSAASEVGLGKRTGDTTRPDFTAAREKAGRGDVDGAISEYRLCARAYPDVPDSLFGIATLLEMEGRYEEAAATWRDIIGKFRDDVTTWTKAATNLATLFREYLDDPDAADGLIEAIRQRNPGFENRRVAPEKNGTGSALGDLDTARAMAKTADVDSAIAMYRKSFARNPENPRPLFGAATLLEVNGRYEEAEALLREIVDTFRGNGKVWADAAYRLGSLFKLYLHDREKAESIFKEIVRRAPMSKAGRLAGEQLTGEGGGGEA